MRPALTRWFSLLALPALLAALLAAPLVSPARADVAVPPLQARVTDLAGVLSSNERAALESTLRAFEERKGSQVAVLLVPTTEPETIEQYGIRVAEQWKLGRKGVDDGAILLVAVKDRTLRIEVGYGLEGPLPDAISKRIVSEVIVPRFKDGDMPGGINAGVAAMLKVIDGEPLPAPKRSSASASYSRGDGASSIGNLLFVGVFIIFAGGWVLRSIFGRLGGSLAGAGAAGVVAWLFSGIVVLGAIAGIVAFLIILFSGMSGLGGALGHMGGGVRRGGFGGFGGGGFGGGGFGGGGFGGGGGGFGGGGASGKW